MATRGTISPAAPAAATPFRSFFLLAALYDGVLGLAFLVAFGPLYAALGAAPPADPVYLRLIAAFVAVQGLGYWFVARAPRRNVDLVKVGAVYKAAYIVVALLARAEGDLPHAVFAGFAAADAFFLAGFLLFLRAVREQDPDRQGGEGA